jgi:hypothetical protein
MSPAIFAESAGEGTLFCGRQFFKSDVYLNGINEQNVLFLPLDENCDCYF